MLREACKQAKRWHTQYPDLRMSVNLSPRQFQHTDLLKMITAALDESGLAPRDLQLEITESAAMQNSERTIATLNRLNEMGIQLALDDFGTGHSSLSYLRRFPIHSVKIDQEFVHAIDWSAADRAIVSAIIAMARGLKLRVVAEGVETRGGTGVPAIGRMRRSAGIPDGTPRAGVSGAPASSRPVVRASSPPPGWRRSCHTSATIASRSFLSVSPRTPNCRLLLNAERYRHDS